MNEPGRRSTPTLVRAAARFRARGRSRRRRVVVGAVAVALVLAMVGGGLWVALASSALGLRTVTVEGTGRVTVAEVLHAAALVPGTSLLRVDPGAVEARVARLPAVDHVTVSRSWPHGLVIHVTERRPVGVVVTDHGAVLLDRTGVPFATVAAPPARLIRVDVDGAVPGPGAAGARAAMDVLAALPSHLRSRVVHVTAPSPEAVSFTLRDGRLVVWGSAEHNPRKVAVLRALLRRPAHRYDVSAPDVAVVS